MVAARRFNFQSHAWCVAGGARALVSDLEPAQRLESGYNLGVVLTELGRLGEAEGIYKEVSPREYAQLDWQHFLAVLWLPNIRLTAARCYFLVSPQTLSEAPDHESTLLNLAALRLHAGDHAEAMVLARRCLKAHPTSDEGSAFMRRLESL